MDQGRLEGMRGGFKGPLLKLKDTLLMMASLTDRNFTMALQALVERNEEKAKTVEAEDEDIDRLEIDVDEMIITFSLFLRHVVTVVFLTNFFIDIFMTFILRNPNQEVRESKIYYPV